MVSSSVEEACSTKLSFILSASCLLPTRRIVGEVISETGTAHQARTEAYPIYTMQVYVQIFNTKFGFSSQKSQDSGMSTGAARNLLQFLQLRFSRARR